MFETAYQLLSDQNPDWGRVAILPWDTDIFGFPVGDLRCDAVAIPSGTLAGFRTRLEAWAEENGVELISCAVAGEDPLGSAFLQMAGFRFVDLSLLASLPQMRSAVFPATRGSVRLAEPDDYEGLERIAEAAFRFGRYHSDPGFPVGLANLRYRRWLWNALHVPEEGTRVYVTGEPGKAIGFFHVVVREDVGDLRLAACDTSLKLPLIGFEIYPATLRQLRQEGVRKAIGKMSAVNTSVINIYSSLGFRFSRSEAIFHWHAQGAPHLTELGGCSGRIITTSQHASNE